jgi:hypothetical protein
MRYVHQLKSVAIAERTSGVTSNRIGALREKGPGATTASGVLDGGGLKPLPGSPSAIMPA